MSACKLRCVDVSGQSALAQLVLNLPAQVLEIIAEAYINDARKNERPEQDNVSLAAGGGIDMHIISPGFGKLCMVHQNWHIALRDYATKYMRKHIMYLQRNYEMMVGANAFMLLRGAYLLKNAADPFAEIEQFNPGKYSEYAYSRNTQVRPGEHWDGPRKFGNPTLPEGQRELVGQYALAMYNGQTAGDALEPLQRDPDAGFALNNEGHLVPIG